MIVHQAWWHEAIFIWGIIFSACFHTSCSEDSLKYVETLVHIDSPLGLVTGHWNNQYGLFVTSFIDDNIRFVDFGEYALNLLSSSVIINDRKNYKLQDQSIFCELPSRMAFDFLYERLFVVCRSDGIIMSIDFRSNSSSFIKNDDAEILTFGSRNSLFLGELPGYDIQIVENSLIYITSGKQLFQIQSSSGSFYDIVKNANYIYFQTIEKYFDFNYNINGTFIQSVAADSSRKLLYVAVSGRYSAILSVNVDNSNPDNYGEVQVLIGNMSNEWVGLSTGSGSVKNNPPISRDGNLYNSQKIPLLSMPTQLRFDEVSSDLYWCEGYPASFGEYYLGSMTIRSLNLDSGEVTTFAGYDFTTQSDRGYNTMGTAGGYRDGLSTLAKFRYPVSIELISLYDDSDVESRSIVVADFGNSALRIISSSTKINETSKVVESVTEKEFVADANIDNDSSSSSSSSEDLDYSGATSSQYPSVSPPPESNSMSGGGGITYSSSDTSTVTDAPVKLPTIAPTAKPFLSSSVKVPSAPTVTNQNVQYVVQDKSILGDIRLGVKSGILAALLGTVIALIGIVISAYRRVLLSEDDEDDEDDPETGALTSNYSTHTIFSRPKKSIARVKVESSTTPERKRSTDSITPKSREHTSRKPSHLDHSDSSDDDEDEKDVDGGRTRRVASRNSRYGKKSKTPPNKEADVEGGRIFRSVRGRKRSDFKGGVDTWESDSAIGEYEYSSNSISSEAPMLRQSSEGGGGGGGGVTGSGGGGGIGSKTVDSQRQEAERVLSQFQSRSENVRVNESLDISFPVLSADFDFDLRTAAATTAAGGVIVTQPLSQDNAPFAAIPVLSTSTISNISDPAVSSSQQQTLIDDTFGEDLFHMSTSSNNYNNNIDSISNSNVIENQSSPILPPLPTASITVAAPQAAVPVAAPMHSMIDLPSLASLAMARLPFRLSTLSTTATSTTTTTTTSSASISPSSNITTTTVGLRSAQQTMNNNEANSNNNNNNLSNRK